MDSENKPKPESTFGDAQPAAITAAAPDSMAVRRALTRLLRKRLKRFIALATELSTDAKPKTVHDVRVRSRRLQQVIGTLFPKPRSGKVRRLRRTARRFRRALGEWRNCDVLLEMVAKQRRRTRSEAKRRAWALVLDYLPLKRSKEVARAKKKLLRAKLGDYVARAERVLRQASDESPDILMQRLGASVQEAWIGWQSALGRAQETRAVGDLHAFRSATKILRYRTELFFEIDAKPLNAQLKSLADLQDVIGVWHDRQVFHRAVAEALARAEVLLNEMQSVRLLLAELEKDRSRQADEVEKIFRLALDHARHHQMASSSETHATPTLSTVTEPVNDKPRMINQEVTL